MPAFHILYVIAAFIIILSVGFVMLRKKKQRRKEGFSTRVTVKGSAVTINGRAAVHTKRAATYYIRGMDAWDINWEGHEVIAIGDLEQESQGAGRYIKDAVVQMLSDKKL